MNYYDVLGVSKNADLNMIKTAYRNLAKKYHPDLNQNSEESTKKFQEISEAYNILSDPTSKKKYDSSHLYTSKTSSYKSDSEYYKKYSNYTDTNKNEKNIISKVKISLTLKEAYSGKYASSSFKIKHNIINQKRCSHCHGTGVVGHYFFNSKKCPYCKGLGIILSNSIKSEKVNFNVNIPPGVTNGTQLYINYNNSYIELNIIIKKHISFQLVGNDIYMTKKISANKIKTGTVAQITNIDGSKIKLHIPPNTLFGQTFRIKERGFNANNQRGNLFIKIIERK